ncbi:MAG: hypothetical protein HY763_16075 [Planctomycetes bacterium]|nr:hypothetical protein [Planctomycetota bacterium]
MLLMLAAPPAPAAEPAGSDASRADPAVRVVPCTLDKRQLRWDLAAAAQDSALPGFRAPVLGHPPSRCVNEPGERTEAIAEAAAFVAQRLAHEGLPRTLVEVMRRFDLPWLDARGMANEPVLWRVGLPVDWLRCFELPSLEATRPDDLIAAVAGLLHGAPASGGPERFEEFSRSLRFRFCPTLPGFSAAAENGTSNPAVLRLQLPLPDEVLGEHDGSAADILHQTARAVSDVPLLISVHEAHVDPLLGAIARWGLPKPERITIVATPLPLTQWAQDNAKGGCVRRADGSCVPATLVPRFASQGEVQSVFLPGESFLIDTLAAAGNPAAQSPLLFQGGNLLVVEDPRQGERFLLLGEAEVLRNRLLGLTREQIEAAFCAEFGVRRCVTLPAVSFHIDLEVSVRCCGGRLVAFVNDSVAAARHVVELGLTALQEHARLAPDRAEEIRTGLRGADPARALAELWRVLAEFEATPGELPEWLAGDFVRSPAESAGDNLRRFLLCADLLTATSLAQGDPAWAELPGERQSYYEELRRREADRPLLHARLEAEGLRVVAVPSLSDEEVSLNYINGVHGEDSYLMPVLGGFFSSLDDVAAGIFRFTFDPGVRLLPVSSALTQRKYGGVHCSLGVYVGRAAAR